MCSLHVSIKKFNTSKIDADLSVSNEVLARVRRLLIGWKGAFC